MEILEKHFEIALNTPDGILRLRELILKLAMQGKLVDQKYTEKSGTDLLLELNIRRKTLSKKFILSETTHTDVILNEPYPVPKGWVWTFLESTGLFINGDRGKNYPSKKDYVTEGIPFINAGHLDNGLIQLEDMNYISEEVYSKLGGGKIHENDILYCLRGSLGKCALAKKINKGAIASSLVIIRPLIPDISLYLYYYLISPLGKNMIYQYDNGTAQPNLSSASIQKFTIPLPPLEEQKRIVIKIEQLMSFCDQLERQRTAQRNLLLNINNAAIHKLVKADNEKSLNQAWAFIERQFEKLYDEKSDIKKLRAVILELAIRGKLVNQSTAKTSSDDLLKFIDSEKEKLSGALMKNKKVLPPIKENEIPFSLPSGWIWLRLGSLCSKIGSGSTPRGGKDIYQKEGIKFIRSQNVHNSGLKFDNVVFIDKETHLKMSNTKVLPNDILLNITGGSIGRCALVPADFVEANVSQHVTVIRLLKGVQHQFVHHFIMSPYFQDKIMEVQTGGNREGLAKKNMELMLVPLPPQEAQLETISKVNSLIKYCDLVDSFIDQASIKKAKILNSVLANI